MAGSAVDYHSACRTIGSSGSRLLRSTEQLAVADSVCFVALIVYDGSG